MSIIRESPDRTDWRVPIKLLVSNYPLFLKIIIGQGFPMISP